MEAVCSSEMKALIYQATPRNLRNNMSLGIFFEEEKAED
jgi:hypothetical protein